MTKLITLMLAIVAMSSQVFAGTSAVNPLLTVPQVDGLDFSAKFYGTSVVSEQDAVDTAWGGGLAVEVPVWENVGIEVNAAVLDLDGESEVRLGTNAIVYLPLVDKLDAYGLVGGGYGFESEEWYVGVGGGLRYSITSTVSAFGDAVYNFGEEVDDVTFRVGVAVSF
jgi:hypothetical protein